MKKEVVAVKGMTCDHCVRSIEGALKDVGVDSKVDLNQGLVEVHYDENKISLDAIKTEIEEQGYDLA